MCILRPELSLADMFFLRQPGKADRMRAKAGELDVLESYQKIPVIIVNISMLRLDGVTFLPRV